MSLLSWMRAPRTWFFVVLLLALGWWSSLSLMVGRQLLDVSKISFRPNPPGMAAGNTPGEPPSILAANAWDGYVWIRHAQDMVERGAWRLKHTDFDNAPEGRGVHWNSGWAWWLIGLGWLDHKITGVPLDSGIARMAMWANPIVYVIFMTGVAIWVARRWGYGAGVMLLLAMAASPGYQEGFAAGYPDHHGLHNAAIVVCVLGLLMGGLGWGRAGEATSSALARVLPDERGARRCFVISAIAGACGLWVSALTLTLVLVGVGVGALAAIAWLGRRRESGVASRPELWRLWGLVGGGASLALYVLEYFPANLGMRLEVNHPLYALAWAGGGELMCRFQRWRMGGARWSAGDWAWAGLAVLAIAALPLAMAAGGAMWYRPFDPFLFNLHKRIAEFQPIWVRAAQGAIWPTVYYMLGMFVPAVLAIVVVFSRKTAGSLRGAACFAAIAGCGVAAVYFYQVRWGMAASSVWLVTAPLGTLAWALPGLAERRWARWIICGLAGAALLFYPLSALNGAMAMRKTPLQSIERANGFVLLFRDMAQFIRASVGPDARVVVLSSPNTSNPTSYFGRFHAIGTLYWENCDGLAEAASLFNATDEDALLRRLTTLGVTHVVFLNEENFLGPYFELQNPTGDRETWKRTFGYRAFFDGKLPVWARPLPYAPPAWLKPLNLDLRILQIAPDQTVPEAFGHIAEYQFVNGNLDGAFSAINSALQGAPDSLPLLLKRAEFLLHAGQIEKATRELRSILPHIPELDRARLCFELAALAVSKEAPRLASELLRETVRLMPNDARAANNLAWILATAKEEGLRNGREAVELAQRAVHKNPDNYMFIGTLGAALAETADFEGAIVATRRALELAQEGDFRNPVTAARERLKAFEARRPWRE